MTGRKPDKRDPPISYRPPAALRQEFLARVERSGLSVSGFITAAVFDQRPPRASRRPPVERKLLAQLLGEAARIRDQLHEVSLTDAGEHSALLIAQAVGELTAIRSALLKAMGRKP